MSASWLLLAIVDLWGCGGQEGSDLEPESDADTDADSDTDTDSDSDSDTDSDTDADSDADVDIPNPYSALVGEERYRFAEASLKDEYTCDLTFDLYGVGRPLIPARCEGCEFVFEVVYVLDEAASSADEGECVAQQEGIYSGVYAYSRAWPDAEYGSAWLASYYGVYYAIGAASFSGEDGLPGQANWQIGYLHDPADPNGEGEGEGAKFSSDYRSGTAQVE